MPEQDPSVLTVHILTPVCLFCCDWLPVSVSGADGYYLMLCFVKVVLKFREAGFMADLSEDQGATLNKKVRSAQLAQYNYIFGKNW